MKRSGGSFKFDDFKRLQKKFEKINQRELDLFFEDVAKELTARLLAKVIKRTPVGQYSRGTGQTGGTLRRGWTAEKNQSAVQYAESLVIHRYGNTFVIEIINPVEYASYVEFGHRTRNHRGWVKGKFMLTISEQELEREAPKIIERKLQRKLGELFK